MTKLIKLVKRPHTTWTVTVPSEVHDRFKDIDYMEFEVREDGILYKPVKV